MKESTIELYLAASVEAAGGEIRKTEWVLRRGCPDRRVFGKAWVELKRPGAVLEAHQEREIEIMRRHGETVWVIDSMEGVDAFIAWAYGGDDGAAL